MAAIHDYMRDAIVFLVDDYNRQERRIYELEQELARKNDMLHGIEEFHRQEETFIPDDLMLGPFTTVDKQKEAARNHVMKSAAIDIGRMMLEKGYIGVEETSKYDELYNGTWYKIHAKAVALKMVF